MDLTNSALQWNLHKRFPTGKNDKISHFGLLQCVEGNFFAQGFPNLTSMNRLETDTGMDLSTGDRVTAQR